MTAVGPPEADVVLSVRGLSKRFPGVVALHDVDIDFHARTVHVLFGENGAGKSTLVKILAGVYQPDGGSVTLDGVPAVDLNPRKSRALGIATVFQEPALVPQLTVAENVSLGSEPVSHGRLARREMRSIATSALERIGTRLDPDALVSSLSRAERQVIEIAKALHRSARVLILDEPTAALTYDESQRLFDIVGQLRQQALSIIYITHRVREIREIGDRISILRDGALLLTDDLRRVDDETMITVMTGRKVGQLFPTMKSAPGRTLLRLDGVTGGSVAAVDLTVRGGEVVGVAGLIGSGKGSIGRLIFGLEPVRAGRIEIDGRPIPSRASPSQRIGQGIIYYPGDRKLDGLIPVRPVRENVSLPVLRRWVRRGIVRTRAERSDVKTVLERLSLRPPLPEALPPTFSGGNQQKIVLARGFLQDFSIHVFDEPTSGVDVGARAEIYELIHRIVDSGSGVLLISSDLAELTGMCSRIYVVSEGRITAELSGSDLTEDRVLPHFFAIEHPDTTMHGSA